MKKYQNVGKLCKVVAASMMLSVLTVGSTVSYAAGATLIQNYGSVVSSMAEDGGDQEEVEITDPREKWHFVDMTGTEIGKTREPGHEYLWTMPVHTVYEVQNIYRKSGQKLQVRGAITSAVHKICNVGIIEPDYNGRYVEDYDSVEHTFDLDQTGYYSVFAKNDNDVAIDISFSYYLR